MTKWQSRSLRAVASFLILGFAIWFTGCAAQQVKSGTAPPAENKRIETISVNDDSGNDIVLIQGNTQLTYTSVKQPFPLAVILYFPDTVLDKNLTAPAVENSMINSIDASPLASNAATARIEIALKQDVAYEVMRDGNDLQIVFHESASIGSMDNTPPTAATSATETPTSEPAEEETVSMNPTTTVAAQSAAAPAATHNPNPPTSDNPTGPALVNRIDFSSESAGKSTLIIGTTAPIEYDLKKVNDKLLTLDLVNTNIPQYRQRPLITTRFSSAVDRILPIQAAGTADARVTIELRESVPYYIEQTDTLLMVHFEASTVPPKTMEEAQLPSWRKIMAQTDTGMTAQPPMPQPAPALQTPAESGTTPQEDRAAGTASKVIELEPANRVVYNVPRTKEFTGEKIALDFYETDIKNVFRILREVSGKNFAIDEDVTGKVTLTLERPVPWDQVLDLVLRMNQLGMVYEGDIIRIATLATLKTEEDLKAARRAAQQKANEQTKALEPLITEYIAVNYSNAQNEILPHLNNILTKDRGKISVDNRNNQIILTDTAEKIRQALEIVRRIDKVTPQVIIEARIVEVNNDFTRDLGIEWSADSGAGGAPNVDSDALGGLYGWDVAMNFPSTAASSSVGFAFSRIAGTPLVLDATLNAIETRGDGKIISAPKILTLDNKKAKIKQGIEFPYLERDDSGGATVKFKDIDLLLEVTPHVTPDNRISMTIYITKNDIDQIFAGVPSLATNEAETELLVNDGDTVVIGGIIKSTTKLDERGWPVLRQVPVVGWLFKNQTDLQEDTELLIFITPRIVQLEQRTASF